jgi:hypothetical protein
MGDDDESARRHRLSEVADKRAEIFAALAESADSIADSADKSAYIHDQIGERMPGAAEHAARDRRLAAAERAAAEAYRKHEVPPDEVRQVVIESREGAGDQTPD